MRLRPLTRRTVLASAAALAATPAIGQSGRVTTLVVPFPPGGSTDALARLLQPGLEHKLGQTMIIENKAGAAGSLGAAQVAKATPDGSTWLVTFDSHAVIPAILEKPPLDVEKDLLPVFLVGTAPYVVAAGADKPYQNFADVIAAAKAKAGSVTYASVGIGTIGHLAMTVLAKRAGVEITHVAYRGGGPAMNDVIGGHVDLVCGSAALVTPHLAGGKVRPVMQMGAKRLQWLPDTQTAIEAGFVDFTAEAWWGVFAPKGTPLAMIATMADALNAVISDPVLSTRLRDTQEMTLRLGGPAVLEPFFAKQIQDWGQDWGKVVRDNNIKAQG
jgi:tripartite-type tricarboxylate transporter receptor subunit TctC